MGMFLIICINNIIICVCRYIDHVEKWIQKSDKQVINWEKIYSYVQLHSLFIVLECTYFQY